MFDLKRFRREKKLANKTLQVQWSVDKVLFLK